MAERLSILNDPPKVLDGPQLLHRLIQWDRYLDGCALDCTSSGRRKKYTYREAKSCVASLESKVLNHIAKANTKTQNPRRHVIPMLLPQSPGLYISQLAVLHSGGAFCPITLEAPRDRIKFIVDDVSAAFVITTAELKESFSWEDGPTVIIVDEFPEVEEKDEIIETSLDIKPDDLAYVMYTSGTSGKPKGVCVSHLAASQSLLAHERHIPQFQRFLQFASPSFDVSVFEIFFPLVRGATLVGCKKDQLLNDLTGMINRLEVDAAELTPTVVGSLLHKRSNTPGLKLLLTIGEPLTKPIVEEFGGSETATNMLCGMYGPTEAAIHCTVYPRMEASAKPGNIGVPFETVSTFIAAPSTSPEDVADLKFVPIGEQGELILGGPQLAQGYLKREKENKAAFVEFEGRRYYRTGDKARQLEDGTIEIFGRISSGQVKLRGQRLELGEIEDAIYKHPGVQTATALVLGSALIVFALIGNETIEPQDVMSTCAKWLPKFMLPSEIIMLQKFPYLASGKVDKKKLEADYNIQREDDQLESEIILTGTKKVVTEVLYEIFGPFSSQTRLATIGLDSLVAIRVASKLRLLGFNVSTIAVLQADTLNSLVHLCENSTSPALTSLGNSKKPLPEITAVALNGNAKDVESTRSSTPLQSAMLSESARNEKAYRNWFEVELHGLSDFGVVIAMIQNLAGYNPILRTGFAESQSPGGYSQVIWREFPTSRIEKVKEFHYEFDPSKDTSLHHPVRVQLLRTSSAIRVLMHIHHALYDAWSLELLLDDLDSLLASRPLTERPPFSDLVEAFEDGSLKTHDWTSKDYWKDHLAHLDIRQLPNFHSSKSLAPGLAIAQLATSITTAEIEMASRSLATSPQSMFQAAYALVLSSYLGSPDICFGTVFSGRTLPVAGIEDMVGPCLATLPLRIDLSAISSIQELVQELNSTNRKHLEHSTVPLHIIKSASGVEPGQQLFDSLLIWQQTLHDYDQKRNHVSLINTADNLEFHLTIEIIPGVGNIEMKANYEQSLFPASQIKILLEQVEQIVSFMVTHPSSPLAGIFNCLDKTVLSIENEQPDVELKGGTLSSPVEDIARRDPDRPAITFVRSIDTGHADTLTISYDQLNKRANRMGHHLLEAMVLPDELVCVCMEKSYDLYASILATAKIGAGYLPLTPDIPPERLEYILREAKVKVIMVNSSSRLLLKSFRSLKFVYVDEVDFSIFSSTNISSRSSPDDISYCVFTSGSTGVPKGVLVTQRNILSNLDVLVELYPATQETRLLQSCSQAFDVSVFEIFFSWRIGGCLCSAVKDVLFRDIEATIRALNITHLSLTPTVAALIDPMNVPSVKFLVTAGEGVTQKVFNKWADRGLWQGYGPSETTNICTVNPQVTKNDLITNIGPPFKNTSAFVLSPGPDFALVPRGGEGEFCFGGSQVFRGYMDRSQEVGKIIEHPIFGRLYRSGDFGRLMPDGSLLFTGRKDDQVKIRGQRVELGEINSVILKSGDVKDCMTMVIGEDNASSQRLVCFWTLGREISEELKRVEPDPVVTERLYKSLESVLPSYMIPSALIPVSFLPSTPQGKIDKRLLLKHFRSLDIIYLSQISQFSRLSTAHTWTALEKIIAEAAANVTQVQLSEIDLDTSFFNIGINSISAISFSRILQQNIRERIEISDILKFPSVVRLAERISSQDETSKTWLDGSEKGNAKAPDFDFDFTRDFQQQIIDMFNRAGKTVQNILPCTPLQEAMLSAAEVSSDKLYNNQVTFDINGDVEKLQACWREITQRHEVLRTCFVNTDMRRYPFVQVVLRDHDVEFGSITSFDEERSPFSEFEPQYRIDILKDRGSTKLILSMHHALYDGVALAILYEEVEKLYNGEKLPDPVLFTPFLKCLASMSTDDSDQFWDATLKNLHPTKLEEVSQNPKPGDQGLSSTRIQRITARSPLSWIESSTKKHSTSLLAACHAAWSCILSEKLQETDVCFGNVVSGRALPIDGIERLVAPCFNTIPSRLQNIQNLTFLEAFRKFQALNAESLPFQLTPLRRIQSKFSPDGSRLFDVLFILQQPARYLDSSIWSILNDSGIMDFPLVCEVIPKHFDDTLEIILHSYTSVLSDEDSHQLLNDFEEKLQTALLNPRRQMLSITSKELINKKVDNREKMRLGISKTKSSSTVMSDDEMKLRDIISDFTDVALQKIGRDISIFRLGLDSISTVQVATRLKRQGHIVLASDILQNPTIAQLSKFLQNQRKSLSHVATYDFEAFDKEHRDMVCSIAGISHMEIEAVRPCTAVQHGMLAQTLHSGGHEYVNSIWFEMQAGESTQKFQDAWTLAFQSHEMFRTGFVSTGLRSHPFVMVTYHKDAFNLPWSENDEQSWDQTSTPKRLTRKPWSLNLTTMNNKTAIQFTAHHALYDAQSIQKLLSDVAAAYLTKIAPTSPSITPLLSAILHNIQDELEAKKQFWELEENKILINHFPDLNPLRISDTTSGVQEYRSQSTVSELEFNCRELGVTMQAASQVAWARILAAYIGEASTTFGMTLSGRSILEDADKISFPSIVTIPVCCNITGTNAEVLSRTMKSNALHHKYQFTPLSSIQKWAGFPEGKIFDTLFAYQKLPGNNEDVKPPWKVIKEEASVDYALSLEVEPLKSGNITFRLTFRKDLIPEKQAEIILRQYDMLLLDTLRNPENICDLAPQAGNELLSITPAEESELPSPVSLLHEFVERGAREWPQKIALQFASDLNSRAISSISWNYEELNSRANRIAHYLIKKNVMPGQIIAICFDKCLEASIAIIGILKSGCAYVALDPNAPGDRLKFILEDSNAQMVLSAGKPAEMLNVLLDKEMVDLTSTAFLGEFPSAEPQLTREISPQDIAYCLYTSGTTGTPKGCLITHENAVQFMLAFSRIFAGHWSEDSKYLQFASFHFDVSVMEQFWSWSVGICVASAPRDMIFEDITGAIQQLQITHLDLTPSLARLLHPDDVPSLLKGAFITGGEQLKQEILDVWGEHAVIYNGYGPTEATIGCTIYPRVPKNGRPSNIGPQYINVGSFVLKPGTELPVLRGGIGELCVSGKLVGKGYLNRPDLTTEKFPTLESFNERVYRTGDLVRILHDGSFIFLGRADDQIKLRGQRLELSEINEVIKKGVEKIQEVVTLVLKHSIQQKEQLVTFFVTTIADDRSLTSALRDACKARLPGYMIPTHFIPIKSLPLNANNKADSKQLAALFNELSLNDLQSLSHSNKQTRQWTDNETHIVKILADALRLEISEITPESNIFELGLDSISIISLSRALQNAGLPNAKMSLVKDNPSLLGLVSALMNGKLIDQKRENAYVAASQMMAAFWQKHFFSFCVDLGVESSKVENAAACTPVQEGMIYRFLESDGALYFNTFRFQLNDEIDPTRLLAAWNCVVKRLEVLRTKFVATEDGFAQVILRSDEVTWSDVTAEYPQEDKYAALKTPWDLALETTSSGIMMTLKIFHGLYDGNSLTMLLRCVVDEYHGLESIEYGPSFLFSLSYGPLASIPEAQEFWTTHLKDWTYHPIPNLLKSSESVVGTRKLMNLSGFEDLRKKLGVTPQAVVQAAWISVLQSILSPKVTVGMVTSGRTIDFNDADKVIGPLFNTVPFLVEIESGMSSATLISKCHQFNMQMQDFQHTPLKDVQKWSPAGVGQPLFENLFVFQRPEVGDETFAKDLWNQVEDEQVADYPLVLEATLSPDNKQLSMVIIAQASIIIESGPAGLLDRLEKTLKETLESFGQVIISKSDSVTGSSPTSNDITTTIPSPLPTPNEPFIWTENAQSIREEMISLAGVNENSVNENSSIFELGLDSIEVIKLSTRLKKRGVEIPVSLIIQSKTIAKMLPYTCSRMNNQNNSPQPSLAQVSKDLTAYLSDIGMLNHDAEEVLPATPLQQSMVNEMKNSNYQRYFNAEMVEINNGVDVERLKDAIKDVVEYSPILRTTFTEIGDPRLPVSYAQVVHKQSEAFGGWSSDMVTFQCSEGATKEKMDEFWTLVGGFAAEGQTLLQLQHYRSDHGADYLVFCISHALYDGTSLQLFHDDIHKAYHGKFESRKDYRPFLERVLQSTTEDAKNFWRASLSNSPRAIFPKKRPEEIEDWEEVHFLERKSQIPLEKIENLCRESLISLQTLGQTCWALVLAHLMGKLDVLFGTVLSCRDSEEAYEIMFPLMNTVAVRSVLHGTLNEMLKYMQVQGNNIGRYPHFPLGTAQAYALSSMEPQELTTDTSLFDTLFIYQGHRRTVSDIEPLYTRIHGHSDLELPICVEMEIVDGHLLWTVRCKSIARDATETEEIIELLETVLEYVIKNPLAPTFLSEEEYASICGLPKFKRQKLTAKSPPPHNPNLNLEKWTKTELDIRRALHEISSIPETSIDKDSTIFHLGLDSILVLKLPALLKAREIKLSVSEILREQTVFGMARAASNSAHRDPVDLDRSLPTKAFSPSRELQKSFENIKYTMPATAGQLYMIKQWQASQGAMFYQTFTYSLPEEFEVKKLERVWKELLSRHDILRTAFTESGSNVTQVILQESENEVIYQTTRRLKVTRKDRTDLQLPPVNLVVDTSEEPHTLKLIIHHALYDGISLPILIEEFHALYKGQHLAEVPTHLFKRVIAESTAFSPKSLMESKWNWKSYLSDEILSNEQKSSIRSTNRTEVFYPGNVILNMKQAAQKIGVSVNALLLAAIAKSYAGKFPKTPSHNVVIGVYLANRAPLGEDLSGLAAPTLNILPLLVKKPHHKTTEEVAKVIQSDIQRISSKDMVSASLADIYKWTGVRVNFVVNILMFGTKDAALLSKRSEVVEEAVNKRIRIPKDGTCDAYLPSVDIEMRYYDCKVDIGVFAPTHMLSVEEGEAMIKEIIEYWQ